MTSATSPTARPTHEGRLAVVTGAAGGLGQAICRGLAERGAAVVGVDVRDLSETGRLVSSTGASWCGFALDITSESDVNRLAEQIVNRFDRCDILINNAGIADVGTWDDLDYELWRKVIRVNLDGQFLMAKAVIPIMRDRRYGRIVNITSTTVTMPIDNFIAYRASKMGVIGLTRALASMGEHGITANAVSPALTPTDMTAGQVPDEVFELFRQAQSIKRTASASDLVPTVLFLSSEESYWVTGQAFSADGGASFNLP